MSINLSKLGDLLTTTYDQVPMDVVDLSMDQQDYLVMPYFMKKNGGMREIGGGVGIGQILMIEHGGRSRFVGEYDEDVIMAIDHLDKMRVDFTLMTDNVSFTLGEIRANRGKELITNVIAPKKKAMYNRTIATMEDAFFGTPNADDDLTPWGLKYWVVKNSTEGGGFNGGYPAGFTRIANLDLAKIPQFKNYADVYTAISKEDLLTKWRRAHRRTRWVMPKKQSGFTGDTSERRIYVTNERVIEELEAIGEGQNENLGNDLAPYTSGDMKNLKGLRIMPDGEILFKRTSVYNAWSLVDDTTDPVYGLDMRYFYPVVRKGDNQQMSSFEKAPNQHRVQVAHYDHAYQFLCINRRSQFVLSK